MKMFNLFRSNSFNMSVELEDILINVKLKLVEDNDCRAHIVITG